MPTEPARNGPSNLAADEIYDNFAADNLETSLVQNDILSHHRSHPTSFVQNRVYGEHLQPKVANSQIYGHNGNAVDNTTNSQPGPSNQQKQKGRMTKFGNLNIFGKKNTKKNNNIKEDNLSNMNSHTHINEASVTTPPEQTHGLGGRSQANSAYNAPLISQTVPTQPVATQVRMVNGVAVTRPMSANIPPPRSEIRVTSTPANGSSTNLKTNKNSDAEIGIARLEMLPPTSARSVVRVQQSPHSLSTSDLSPQKRAMCNAWHETQFGDSELDKKRPSSLALQGHNYVTSNSDLAWLLENAKHLAEECSTSVSTDNNVKIRQRVKTPSKVKNGRFSLYDDRLMDSAVINDTKLKGQSLDMRSSNSAHEIYVDGHSNIYNTTNHNC